MLKYFLGLFRRDEPSWQQVLAARSDFAAKALTLAQHGVASAEALQPDEIRAINEVAIALRTGSNLPLAWPDATVERLRTALASSISIREVLADEAERKRIHTERRASSEWLVFRHAHVSQPRWTIVFSEAFVRSISRVDKSLQGRILEALTKLSEDPMEAVGDTVKPLVGSRKGIWRYRIGNYRLLYDPLLNSHEIVLLSFEARGEAYSTH